MWISFDLWAAEKTRDQKKFTRLRKKIMSLVTFRTAFHQSPTFGTTKCDWSNILTCTTLVQDPFRPILSLILLDSALDLALGALGEDIEEPVKGKPEKKKKTGKVRFVSTKNPMFRHHDCFALHTITRNYH